LLGGAVAKVHEAKTATSRLDTAPARREAAGERPVPHWRVAIIGAGAGGLGLAIRLRKARQRDFVVFEASDGVGGTWRSNTYPGAACDVPSHLYSYSFARKPDWTKTYAGQSEILRYLEDCAERFGISDHVRTRTRMTAAHWDEQARRWRLTDAEGGRYEADVLVSAVGTFATPSYPDIAGLDSFAGPCFHSARWEHEHDLVGRRVAVIGTGASAAQIVPELAKVAEAVDVFQRTPQWILPRSDKPFTEEQKRRFARNPMAARRHRRELYWAFENTIAFRHGEEGAEQLKAIALSHIEYRIKDDDLRGKLTPNYPFGCKRTLVCSDFYKAVLRNNVELVTERIERVTPGAVVTTGGREHPVDAIVLATGFRATEYLEGFVVVGVGGRRLHDDWSEVPHAYMGLTVAGYPNFFMLYGPNTNQGGNSIIVILEAQSAYVLSALRAMRWRRARAVDVRPEVMDAYNRELQEALAGTVWSDGCQSYFTNANGKIATQLPQTSRWYAQRTKHFRMREYVRS
jgi:cation diffusion facilitator CzcD-associated flavoprotein CzcO